MSKEYKAYLRSLTDVCMYCKEFRGAYLEVEHIVSWKHGGDNHPDNLTIACYKCNSSKGDRQLIEWLNYVKIKRDKALYLTLKHLGRMKESKSRGSKFYDHHENNFLPRRREYKYWHRIVVTLTEGSFTLEKREVRHE